MTIEERLDRLEKQNRNLRRGLGGVLLLVLVVPLAAFVWQDKKKDVLKVKRLEAEVVVLVKPSKLAQPGEKTRCTLAPNIIAFENRSGHVVATLGSLYYLQLQDGKLVEKGGGRCPVRLGWFMFVG